MFDPETDGRHVPDSKSKYTWKNYPPPTVDGRNPAPPGMYETLQIMG